MKKKVILTIMVALSVAIAGCGSKGKNIESQQKVAVKDTNSKKAEHQKKNSEKDIKKSEESDSEKEEIIVKEDEKAVSQQTVLTDNNSSDTNSSSNGNTANNNGSGNTAGNSNSGLTSSGSTSSGGSSSGGSSNSSNGNLTPAPTSTPEPVHTHTWVHVDATGHFEPIEIRAAYDEEVPVYGNVEHQICNDCSVDISDWSSSAIDEHLYQHMLNGGKGGYHSEWRYEQTGTQTIHHEAVTENRWVEDSPAYDVCSGCGLTR